MITLTLCIAVTGLLLGLRYKVLVLIPITALVLLMSGAYGVALGMASTTTILSMLAAVVVLQFSYLAGVAMYFAATKMRIQMSRLRLRAERV